MRWAQAGSADKDLEMGAKPLQGMRRETDHVFNRSRRYQDLFRESEEAQGLCLGCQSDRRISNDYLYPLGHADNGQLRFPDRYCQSRSSSYS